MANRSQGVVGKIQNEEEISKYYKKGKSVQLPSKGFWTDFYINECL